MNKNTPYSSAELHKMQELRSMEYTHAEIAKKLGRSAKSVAKQIAKQRKEATDYMGYESSAEIKPSEDFPWDSEICDIKPAAEAPVEKKFAKLRKPGGLDAPMRAPVSKESPWKSLVKRATYWKLEAQHLQGVLSSQQHDKTAVDILVEKAVELAPLSYKPVAKAHSFLGRAGKSEQSAVLVFSDTHIGQVVKPEQTLGMGGYDFEIFLRRLARLERSVFSILKDHTTSHIPEIVVAMLGDMIHGNLSHAVEAGQVNTVFTQFYSAGHAIAQFLRNLSTIAPVRVHTAVGNHPRWGTQKKMPTDNRFSNLDQFLYSYLAALLRDVPSISIKLDEQPFSRFDVQGFHFLAGHGDTLRGGDKNLGIPNHAIGRNVSVHSQLAMRSGNPIPNYYLVGHLHRQISLPHCSGEFLVNGGFPGIDGYALAEAFNSSFPSQKFFLVHKKFGRSATYDLRLDLGDQTPHSYSLPENFCCK